MCSDDTKKARRGPQCAYDLIMEECKPELQRLRDISSSHAFKALDVQAQKAIAIIKIEALRAGAEIDRAHRKEFPQVQLPQVEELHYGD